MLIQLRRVTVLAALALLPAGCTDMVGVIAHAVPQNSVAAAYKGLQKQTVGIMVWADSGVTIDHPTVKVDLAHRIEENLRTAQDAKIEDLKGVIWMRAEKIARFQEDHPELEGEDLQTIAPKLPVTRLIYVEITSLATHPMDAVDLWRGTISANIKVYEVKDDVAKVAFAENDVKIVYPPKSQPEGVSGLDEDEVYRASMNEISKEIAVRFVTHEQDAE